MKFSIIFLFLVFTFFSQTFATTQTLDVKLNETIYETATYNENGVWTKNNLLTGKIQIINTNPIETISDIYIYLNNASNIQAIEHFSGINGSLIDFGGNEFILHIPQLQPTNISIWNYTILNTINTPILFNTSYSKYKILSGETITLYDNITNQFNNASYQNSCISNINIVQNTLFAGNSSFGAFLFGGATLGSDAGNVVYAGANRIQTWDVLGGVCLNKGISTDINYEIQAPNNISNAKIFNISNTTISYNIDETVSQLRIKNIEAIGDGNLTLSKVILKPSHPTLYGRNVTWQLNGSFQTDTTLNYRLKKSTFWVSQRNVGGLYTNISLIDVDGINNTKNLNISYSPATIINSTNFWQSPNWLFNYSDTPSPITWMDVNFTIDNDGTQIINSTNTKSESSIYYKQLVVVSGYLLEITKNITSIDTNKYNIKIKIFNKGNQITPSGSVVTIYDFVPEGFVLSSGFTYSSTPWYSTTRSNNSVSGNMNGELQRWALVPSNSQNTSLASGPTPTADNTWSVEFNITGSGEYNVQDVFVTGLDPERVDGAGAVEGIIIENYYKENTIFGTVMAGLAGILTVLVLLI